MSDEGIFRRTVLPNGLTVVSERCPGFRSLAVGVWVRAGTRHEESGEAGISHFLEHMLFKGTSSRTALEIAREIERKGGDFNAFTSREYTCFHALTLDNDLPAAVEILGDVLMNSLFESEELDRERKVILQEIAMIEESPEEMVHDIFLELCYGQHGLGRNILGSGASVRRMQRAQVLRFFKKHYQPANLVLSVSGDVPHSAVLREVGKWFKGVKPATRAMRLPPPAVPAPPIRPGNWWIERPVEQVHLMWGVPGIRFSDKDRYAAYLLNVELGGGMSSLLFQEIREKKAMAYSVYSSLMPFEDSGIFHVYAATAMGRVLPCLKEIEGCMAKMRTEPLSKAHLAMLKENLRGSVFLSADSVEARMFAIARNELFLRRHVPMAEVCMGINSVTSSDVRRVAARFLDGGKSIVALGPKPSKAIVRQLRPERPGRYRRT